MTVYNSERWNTLNLELAKWFLALSEPKRMDELFRGSDSNKFQASFTEISILLQGHRYISY
jgi:hypothetical protein